MKEDKQILVCELFAGIGAQAQALENIGVDHRCVVCEIDKFAYRSYCAIHGVSANLGDITTVSSLPAETDLVTWSFPCQDLSIAGDRRGMEEGSGTRSSLAWEVIRLLENQKTLAEKGLVKMPEYLIMENVPALLNKTNMPAFQKILNALEDLGYTNSYKVLNAKDFGVPQNRKRVFMVSALHGKKFKFPEGRPLDKCLRDMLEEDVDESFFFTDEKIAKYEEHKIRHKQAGHGFGWHPTHGEGIGSSVTTKPERHASNFIIVAGEMPDTKVVQAKRVYDISGISPTMTAGGGSGSIAKIEVVGDLHMDGRHESANRVYGTDGLAPTIPTGAGGGHMPKIDTAEEKLRIRYLTPRECWRLQGFPDSAYDKAAEVCSKTQLYKQAGNSIAVPCLEAIFRGILMENSWEEKTGLDRWLE